MSLKKANIIKPTTNKIPILQVKLRKLSERGDPFIFSAANSKYGLISNNYFVMSNFDKEDLVYSFKEKKFINSLNSNIKKMKLLNNGYYEMSKYLRYHNE